MILEISPKYRSQRTLSDRALTVTYVYHGAFLRASHKERLTQLLIGVDWSLLRLKENAIKLFNGVKWTRGWLGRLVIRLLIMIIKVKTKEEC